MKIIAFPNEYKNQGISEKSAEGESPELKYVSDKCERAFNANLETLEDVPDRFKSQEICEKVIDKKMYFLQYVTDRCKTK